MKQSCYLDARSWLIRRMQNCPNRRGVSQGSLWGCVTKKTCQRERSVKEPRLPMFTDNQLKGNWGEQYVSSMLTACDCLVRHVTGGTDSGIDLYCESVHDEKPFLHFFVQVKTSLDFNKKNSDCSYTEKNKSAEKINYWKRQPVPVFIFLVPDQRGLNRPPIFICSVLNFRSTTVRSSLKVTGTKNLKKKFLEDFLQRETSYWSLLKGHLSPLPSPRETSVRWYPENVFSSTEVRGDVSRTLHDSLWRLSEDLLKLGFDITAFKLKSRSKLAEAGSYVNALEALLACMPNEHVSRITVGLWHVAKGENETAGNWIEDGISIIQKKLRETGDIERKRHLKRHLKNAQTYMKKIKNHI